MWPGSSTSVGRWRILAFVDEPEPGWSLGDQILVEMPDGQVVRCRVVNITLDGTVHLTWATFERSGVGHLVDLRVCSSGGADVRTNRARRVLWWRMSAR